MRHGLAILGLVCAAGGLLATPRLGVAQLPLAEERCRLVAPQVPAAYARCGAIAVPLDPAAPQGATIDLFVARIAALNAEPEQDPLLVITGGPGQSTVDFYLQSRAAFEPVRRERDLILVDQRGTGRSAEGFECEVPKEQDLYAAGPERIEGVARDCLASLDQDPRLYTTSVAVQDLERVRTALGLERWNVYGVSYGTRVAQHYVRRNPERVRALVLDGVVPPTLALGPDVAREAQRALDQVFARCAAEPGCGTRFPALPLDFEALLAALDADAGAAAASPTPPRALTAPELRALVRFMSYSPATAALLPVMLHEARAGNVAPLATLADSLIDDLANSLSFPMSNAVTCTEDVPFVAPEATVGLAATYLGTSMVDGLAAICASWPRGVIDEDFKTAVVSDLPVLLLSGEYDPITPPAYAEQVKTTGLRNSVHVIGAKQGHGLVGVGCVPRILRAFLVTPDPAAVDASCLDLEPPTPFFLSLLGPAP
jgi:pimeloyl-ACP methyl ester carboxylesterase